MDETNKFYNETLNRLETAINGLEIEVDKLLTRIQAIISTIIQCLSEVKEYVLKARFSDEDEEIRFFKYQKPAIVAKLIYYNFCLPQIKYIPHSMWLIFPNLPKNVSIFVRFRLQKNDFKWKGTEKGLYLVNCQDALYSTKNTVQILFRIVRYHCP